MKHGHTYTRDDGTTVWSAEPMNQSELAEHWKFVDANSAYMEAHSDEYDYEPYYTLGEPRY